MHIGPYKTGSTAIQSSLHEHREELAAPAITYPGSSTARCARAGPCSVAAASVRPTYRGRVGRDGRRGTSGARARGDHQRGLLLGPPRRARKLVDDLGADLVHVLIVARRLDKLLPSAWQERVKSVNETRTYDTWLREVLAKERTGRAARSSGTTTASTA